MATPGGLLRLVNAALAVVAAAFFLAHSALGATSLLVEGPRNEFPWLVWGMLAIVGAHVCASVAATYAVMADKDRPASARKKGHFVLKWATGITLASAVAAHVMSLTGNPLVCKLLFICVALTLAWHVIVAAKSLARDLCLSCRTRDVLRAGYAIALVAIVAVVTWSFVA